MSVEYGGTPVCTSVGAGTQGVYSNKNKTGGLAQTFLRIPKKNKYSVKTAP